MTPHHYLKTLTILDCLLSPFKVVRYVKVLMKDYDELARTVTVVQAADKELVERLQMVYIPGNMAVLDKEVAKRIVRGGIA